VLPAERAEDDWDGLTAVVTYDLRMPETARAEGLPAQAPGMAD
jgi:hypothetical protein